MKLQIELAETLRKITQELLSIRLVLESDVDVIGERNRGCE